VAKSYRPVQRDQPFLMPVNMRGWLSADHLVWFLVETVDALIPVPFRPDAGWAAAPQPGS